MVENKTGSEETKTISFLRQRENKTNAKKFFSLLIISLFCITYKAHALGVRSTANCGVDYFRYCSQYPVGSDEVRECFRRNGHNLTDACVDALLADGEVTKEEVDGEREKAKQQQETKPVEEVKPPEVITPPPVIEAPPVVEEVKPKESFARVIIGKVINKTKQVKKTVTKKVKANNDKWKGYPLFLEPYSNVPKDTMGSTITNYGIYDR